MMPFFGKVLLRILLLLGGIFFLFSAFDLWFFGEYQEARLRHIPGMILFNLFLGLLSWFGATRL